MRGSLAIFFRPESPPTRSVSGADFGPPGLCSSKFRSPQAGLDGRHLGQIQQGPTK